MPVGVKERKPCESDTAVSSRRQTSDRAMSVDAHDASVGRFFDKALLEFLATRGQAERDVHPATSVLVGSPHVEATFLELVVDQGRLFIG